MAIIEGITRFTDELSNQKIAFGVIDGLAVFAYGGERTTFEIHFMVHGRHKEEVRTIAQRLQLKVTNENFEVLQLVGEAQIDIVFANRPTSQAMLTRVRRVGTFPFPVVAPEDLIGLKTQTFAGDRSQEPRVKNEILAIMKNVPQLDFHKIKEYADVFQVWDEILDLKNRV